MTESKTGLSVLIVDDEAPARQRLARLLSEIDSGAATAEAANGADAIALSQTGDYDVALLDIRMPGMDGIEAARHLALLDKPPAIIFTTAYDQYAVDAFETEAIGYLLKPVRRERLDAALGKAVKLSRSRMATLASSAKVPQQERRNLCARIHGELRLIPTADILYFEADQKYVRAWHRRGDDLLDESLKSLEEEFANDFVRIHRKMLVSTKHIEALERVSGGGSQIRLRGLDRELPVSRRHVATVRARLTI